MGKCSNMYKIKLLSKGEKKHSGGKVGQQKGGRTFWGDGNVLFLDCGDGYWGAYIYQTSSKCLEISPP